MAFKVLKYQMYASRGMRAAGKSGRVVHNYKKFGNICSR